MALKLQIAEEHDDGQQIRFYSLEDLRELQNKLMLMSGKGDQGQNEVDHFSEVLKLFCFIGICHFDLYPPEMSVLIEPFFTDYELLL